MNTIRYGLPKGSNFGKGSELIKLFFLFLDLKGSDEPEILCPASMKFDLRHQQIRKCDLQVGLLPIVHRNKNIGVSKFQNPGAQIIGPGAQHILEGDCKITSDSVEVLVARGLIFIALAERG